MSRRELFQQISLNERERIPQRPLGDISTYVVEKLPSQLERVKSQEISADIISQEIVSLIRQLSEKTISQLLSRAGRKDPGIAGNYPYDQKLDQAALDLKFLEIGLINIGAVPPTELTELVDRFSAATNQLAMISYEDLIYINPESDPRTFTRGPVGNSEYDFYFGHLRIERSLESIIRQVEYAIFQLESESPKVDQAADELDSAVKLFKDVLEDLAAIGLKMPKEHFSLFRGFFNSHPVRNLKGPSGAFTAAIPILDMQIGGENLDDKYFDYLGQNENYFPRKGRRDILRSREQIRRGRTLTALSQKLGDPEIILIKIRELSELLREFRGLHYKSVSHQIPEAVAGKLAGTGGESDPGTFLRERMRMRHVKPDTR